MTNNNVTLIGNIGAHPTIGESAEGKAYAFIKLATQDSYKKDDQWIEKEPVWHDVKVFLPSAVEAVKSLQKGNRIKVSANLQYQAVDTGGEYPLQVAQIVAYKVEEAPLAKKADAPAEAAA